MQHNRSLQQKQRLFESDSWECFILDATSEGQLRHVLPKAKGGHISPKDGLPTAEVCRKPAMVFLCRLDLNVVLDGALACVSINFGFG